MKPLCIFTLLSFIFTAAIVSGQNIGADQASTLRIIGGLCRPENRNEKVAQEFYRCYNKAPGKREFSICQLKVFGCLLNNSRVIGALCQALLKQQSEGGPPKDFAKYTMCLQEEFKKESLALGPSVLAVNICQANAVGVN